MAECNERAKWQGSITYRRTDGVAKQASGASVKVVEVGTNNAINLYTAHTGGPKANPFILDGGGNGDFYVDEADCIFDMIVEAPAGQFATFRRRSQVAAWADRSPWPYDMDADAHSLVRLSNIFELPVVVVNNLDFQDALDRLTAQGGRGAIIVPPGDYAAPDGGWDVTNARTIQDLMLLGYGPDSHFLPDNAANFGPLLHMASGARTARYVFRNFRLDGLNGANIATPFAGGGDAGLLHVKRADDITIESIWAHDVADPEADHIRIGHHFVAGDYVTNVNARDLHCDNAGRNGVAVICAEGVAVTDSEFNDCDFASVLIEPNDITDVGVNENRCREIKVARCDSKGGGVTWSGAAFAVVILDGNKDVDHQGYTFDDCTVIDPPGAGFMCIGGQQVRFDKCGVEGAEQNTPPPPGSAAAGFQILGVLNCWLTDCHANAGVQSHGMRIGADFGGHERGTRNVTVTNFVARGNPGSGIRIQEGLGITEDNHNITIHGGTIFDNSQSGIVVDSSCVADTLRLTIANVQFDSNGGGAFWPVEFQNPSVIRGFLYLGNTSIGHTGAGGSNSVRTTTGTFSTYKVISATNEDAGEV